MSCAIRWTLVGGRLPRVGGALAALLTFQRCQHIPHVHVGGLTAFSWRRAKCDDFVLVPAVRAKGSARVTPRVGARHGFYNRGR